MATIKIEDKDGNLTDDWIMAWSMEGDERIGARHGVDLGIDGKRIQITVTRARKKLRIFVDSDEYVKK